MYILYISPPSVIKFYQYRKHDKDLCPLLDGIFSFVLLDESVEPPRILAARDPIGVTTLYQGWSSSRPGAVFFSSELKCLDEECDKIISFPPGHVFDSRDGSLTRYYTPSWLDGDSDSPNAVIPSQAADLRLIRETLEAAVKKRLMSEVPYGVLLSGGLDSSVIAAVAARETEKIAQAQFEVRQRWLAQPDAGLASPPTGYSYSGETEESEHTLVSTTPFFPLNTFLSLHSHNRVLAAAALIFYRLGAFPRPPRRTESGSLSGYRASRIRLHGSRRPGRHPRRNIPSGDV